MVKSMTGYGRGKKVEKGRLVEVEVNSLNNRYLNLDIKLPKVLMSFKEDIRKTIEENISRGKLEVRINYNSEEKEDYNIIVNDNLCEKYLSVLEKMGKDFDLQDDMSIMKISEIPDIIEITQDISDKDAIEKLINDALVEALVDLRYMRSKEGKELKDDILSKLVTIDETILEIKERSPIVGVEYKENLQKKIKQILSDEEIDKGRLLTEIAIFADKTSIDEELIRLESHVYQLKDALDKGGVIGRKLDFLIQEINREINTIGSKANDLRISKKVIKLKSEMEKIREQVQNIE